MELRNNVLKLIGRSLLLVTLLSFGLGLMGPRSLAAAGPLTPEALEAFFDAELTRQMADEGLVGATVAVVQGDALTFTKGYGYADLEAGTPVDVDRTLFYIGSDGKLFTWTAVMQLVEQGRLDLHADINTYLDFEIPATFPEPITLHHLMTHTAGFEEQLEALFVAEEADLLPLRDFLVRNRPARVYPPGEIYAYSNYGTALAGHIVARISRESYEDTITTQLLEPLGMTRSAAVQPLPSELAPDLSLGYQMRDGVPEPRDFEWVAAAPCAAIRATAPDVGRFMRAHLNGGCVDGVCILAQLHGPLCEAVLGHEADEDAEATDHAAMQATGQAMLERLDRANLFLIPLDDRRRWYRYHHLFADSLRILLDPAEAHELHRRAARWFIAHASPLEAVRHARAADDLAFTAEMIEQAVQQPAAWSGGELATLVSWLDVLPQTILNARPTLSLHASRALFLSGRITQAERLLDRAVAALQEQGRVQSDLEPVEVEALLALADVYRGATAAMRGQVRLAVTHARQALPLLPTSAAHARARALDTLGLAYLLAGEAQQAEKHYLQASDLGQNAGVAYLAINARCAAAQAQMHQGRLRDAAQTCREALALSPTPIPPQGLAWTVLGEIAYEQNDLPTAEAYLQKGLRLSQQGGISDDMQVALSSMVWLRQAQGDEAAAQRLLAQVTAILETYEAQWLMQRLAAARARLDLAQGRLADAVAWAASYAARDATKDEIADDLERLTVARVCIATDKNEQAQSLLDEIRAEAEPAGRLRTALEALILTALACRHRAHRSAERSPISQNGTRVPCARLALGDAVELAAPGRWLRSFLDEGEHLAPLLPQVRDRSPAFVDELLDLMGVPPNAKSEMQPDRHALAEPLSERELEILVLLAEGMTNREIATQLFLSVGTIKWYLHNLYETLDVGNRTEAVAQARELGLIP